MQHHIEEAKGTNQDVVKAVAINDLFLLENMIKHGLEVNQFNDSELQDSLLHIAVRNNSDGTVKFLIDKGINVDLRNKNGESALHLCCGSTSKPQIAELLVLLGASTGVKNLIGDTPVTLAQRCGH
jgi:ankyrin repeat protein